MNYIEQYYQKIKSGKCIVSSRVKKQYEKLVNDLNNPSAGYTFDNNRATKPIRFIEQFCKHSKGE